MKESAARDQELWWCLNVQDAAAGCHPLRVAITDASATAVAIAVVKAAIVALIFMHLRWDRPFNLLVLIGSIVFVGIMLAFSAMDVHQNSPTMFNGNPPEAETVMQANAPGAPVAQFRSTNGGVGDTN